MPVSFLSILQRERYGRYPETLTADELARFFHLNDDDREWLATRRGDSSRLGCALQLTTVRFLGTFLEDPAAVPAMVLRAVADQLAIADAACVLAYRDSEQRWRHTTEIRARFSYREFADPGSRFRLGRWLCAMCWTGSDRPSMLFEQAVGWLMDHKVLLPGVTVLERFVAEARGRMEARSWRLLTRGVSPEQRGRLESLLEPVPEGGGRQSLLDQLRKGPVRVSAPALVLALERIETIRGLGIRLTRTSVPHGRIASMARFAGTAKVSAIARLPEARRAATLVAFVHSLEASAHDDALEVLDQLLRQLFSNARKADGKTRQRSLKDLDRAASILVEACGMLLDPDLPAGELRGRVYAAVGHDELTRALNDVRSLVRPPDDVFYSELAAKQATVTRFLPTLLRVIQFDANPAAQPLLRALEWLRGNSGGEPDTTIVDRAWRRHVMGSKGQVNLKAFTFCLLDKLRMALRRRDVFVQRSWRYTDPRAGLLAGAAWEATRPLVCRSLELSAQPQPTLDALARELDETYRRVAARLPDNAAVRLNGDGTELILSPLEALEEPPSLTALRHEIRARIPRVDLPEILLETAARTGCIEAFTHLTERTARAADLITSLCAVLLAEACNTGLEPFVRPEVPALKRDRLLWVDQNYARAETLSACNEVLVAAQNRIGLARLWGGGDVASADGMRFVVPVRTIHSGPNPKYFNRGRGVTWYNLLSDQRTGLNAVTVPGTLRDSLVLLAVVLDQQTELQPTRLMTDTGAYSDVVFGLFRLLGYRFSPRLADIGGTRFWRIDTDADYGELDALARQRVSLARITPHWDDVLWLIGSLKLGLVPAMGIMRTLQIDERPTRLAQAVAEIGRIDKTIHALNFIDDESRRRGTLMQLNLGEGRHSLARSIFHGKRGELFQRYREGQEDQLNALGLVVNMVVLWNTLYMDAVLNELRRENWRINPEDAARLSPFGHEHIHMLGRYSFSVPEAVARGELRPLSRANDTPAP